MRKNGPFGFTLLSGEVFPISEVLQHLIYLFINPLFSPTVSSNIFLPHCSPLSTPLPVSQQRGDPDPSALHSAFSQTLQQREPVEHPEEQHRQGPVQGGHAGAAQRAHQHPAEAV